MSRPAIITFNHESFVAKINTLNVAIFRLISTAETDSQDTPLDSTVTHYAIYRHFHLPSFDLPWHRRKIFKWIHSKLIEFNWICFHSFDEIFIFPMKSLREMTCDTRGVLSSASEFFLPADSGRSSASDKKLRIPIGSARYFLFL